MHDIYIENCLFKTRKNIKKLGNKFPHVSKNGIYKKIDNVEWTSGFWVGIIWLSFLLSKDNLFKDYAFDILPSFEKRLRNKINIDTHDLGFLYMYSCVPAFKIFKNMKAYEITILAVKKLVQRFIPKLEYIQAFGGVGENNESTYFIVDSLMNLPLLYWASIVNDNLYYKEIAERHALSVIKHLLRADGSIYQACYYNQKTGLTAKVGTIQGFNDESCWSRGQSWAIYGFTLSYKYTKNNIFLDAAKKTADYFIKELPDDKICYWDLIYKNNNSQPRDSSASAIAVCGLLELSDLLNSTDSKKNYYSKIAYEILDSLCLHCTTPKEDNKDGLLLHCVYHLPEKLGIDESCIFGDYFYFEALIRKIGLKSLLWY